MLNLCTGHIDSICVCHVRPRPPKKYIWRANEESSKPIVNEKFGKIPSELFGDLL